MAAETPIFPGFVLVSSSHSGKPENAGLYNYYKSSARYEEVKEFYIKALSERGWGSPHEDDVPKWFTKDGSKALSFQKGEYKVDIEYNADASSPWRFALNYVWEAK
jgi:hypothetical protein